MPTLPESDGAPPSPEGARTSASPAEALRARLRAVVQVEQARREPAAVAPAPVATSTSQSTSPSPVAVSSVVPLVASPPADATGPEALWDAPKAPVEEPISPFLIPIEPEPLRPHERVEVAPVRAALPQARVVALPPEAPAPVVPPDERPTLEAHVERILTLLRTDEIDEAIAQQDTATQDAPSATLRTRWLWTKELVGVAKSLPPRVVQVIATAIGRDDLASAKPDLVAFRQANHGPARDADVVLRTRAKTLQRGVAGALYVEPPIAAPVPLTVRPYESPRPSGAANAWWILIVVVLAIVRVAVRTSSHNSYDYSYRPSYDYASSYPDYQRTAELLAAMEKSRQQDTTPTVESASPFEEPAPFVKSASQEQMVGEIERSLFLLRENYWLTDAQTEKMSALWVTSPYYTECTEARAAMKAWDKLPMSDDLELAKRHIKGVRQRIDALCPAKKKAAAVTKTKTKKVEQPVEKMELTDTPPTN